MNRREIQESTRFRSQARKTWKIRVNPGWSSVVATYGGRDGNTGLVNATSNRGSFQAIDIGFSGKGQGEFIPATIVNRSVAFVDYG